MQGEPGSALEDYERAIELGAQGIVYEYRGLALLELGGYARAVQDFTKVLGEHPNDSHIREKRGDALMAQGDVNNALQDYRKALDIVNASTRELIGRELRANEWNPDAERIRKKIEKIQALHGEDE